MRDPMEDGSWELGVGNPIFYLLISVCSVISMVKHIPLLAGETPASTVVR